MQEVTGSIPVTSTKNSGPEVPAPFFVNESFGSKILLEFAAF